MFDGESFGKEMVEIVRGFVAAELEPILAANEALATANAALIERIAAVEERERIVPEKGEAGQDGRDGADCDMAVVRELLAGLVDEAVAALPPAEKGDAGTDGRDGADGLPGRDGVDGKDGVNGKDIDRIAIEQNGRDVVFSFEVGDTEFRATLELPESPPGKDGERGAEGPSGKLELARAWTDDVHYEGSVRTHNGGAWQALRDTAKEPPHADWICLASRGADGRDGDGFNLRELWQADGEYKRLDVVALNGAAWAAKVDDPGPCPGDGWQLFSKQGKTGERGERGYKGDRGDAGPPIASASIDDEGVQRFINADGTTVECDLYPLLSRFAAK